MRSSLTQRTAILLCASALLATSAIAQTTPVSGPTPDSLAAASAVPTIAAGLAERAAAVVNDQVITNYDVIQRVRLIVVNDHLTPTDAMLPLLEREALNQLIDQNLELQELRKEQTDRKIKSLISSDKDVDSQVADMAAQNSMSTANFLQQLQGVGIDPSAFREQMRVDTSWDNWIRSAYSSHIAISERDIAQYQQAQAANASQTQYHIQEILLDPSKYGGLDTTLDGAKSIINQVVSLGGSFSLAAKNVSSAASAANGGDMGMITADDLPPAVSKAVVDMKAGDYSQPIVTPDGIYIIHLVEKREPSDAILVTLKQALAPLAANADAGQIVAATNKLNQVRAAANGCDGFESAAARMKGVSVQSLGETAISDLNPAFQQAVRPLRPGQVSAPLRSGVGMTVLAVCAERSGGDEALSHDQVLNLLAGNRLDQAKRGAVRDLRNQATIVIQ